MSATRFYFDPTNTPNISPSFNAGWEQTGTAVRRKLLYKRTLFVLSTLADVGSFTVPVTTTQDCLGIQFISDPIPAQNIDTSCLFSLVIRVFENANTNNVTLAVVVSVVSQDGTATRGTLFSNFNQDTEFPLSASAATRIVAASAVTNVITQPGDRVVIEVGGHATGPTAAGSFTMRCGNSNAADFALTTALTTDLNPWCEFSRDLFNVDTNNYKFIDAGSGLSVTEKIR
jgi:hypothetical protein